MLRRSATSRRRPREHQLLLGSVKTPVWELELVLYVPSVLVPEERNAILNPNHPEFAELRMRIERDVQYDPSMHLPRRVPRATG
jgi:hypothetical protein